VRITVVEANSLALDPAAGTVAVGYRLRIPATLEDAAVTELTARRVDWTTRDPEIAVVEGSGLVRGLRPGTTEIEASAGGLTARASIRVLGVHRDPCRELEGIRADLLAIEEAQPDSELADKIEDVREETESAWFERCAKDPPDRKSSAGDIAGAIGDLEDALDDGLLGTDEGHAFAHRLLDVSRTMAQEAIAAAEDRGGRSKRIRQARERRDEADALREAGRFKRAADRYESAISRAERA
jgi:hypothetical protein